ncbi:hypothetical protein BD289DRAFT_253584 [Coniella lustricola]|uniref:Uncharacterized protein n=1 Tax=Coniella lustricola TaxID=2025994 RepID=A0A2T3A855_9PEZI|nr:hypothetical protein BD289DRAFT_253584 [Coniella lustricola]
MLECLERHAAVRLANEKVGLRGVSGVHEPERGRGQMKRALERYAGWQAARDGRFGLQEEDIGKRWTNVMQCITRVPCARIAMYPGILTMGWAQTWDETSRRGRVGRIDRTDKSWEVTHRDGPRGPRHNIDRSPSCCCSRGNCASNNGRYGVFEANTRAN